MNRYEKIVGFKTLWQTIVRRYLAILTIFVPIALAMVIYTQGFIKKVYESSVSLTRTGGIDTTQYKLFIPTAIKNNSTAEAVHDNLKNAGIKHSSGSEITIGEIYDGVMIDLTIPNAVGTVQFSFQSSDKAITKVVADEIINVALPIISTNLDNVTATNATAPKKNSKDTTYLLIGLGVDAVLALVFAFVYEIISDEVYDKADIENLGCGGFEFTVSK